MSERFQSWIKESEPGCVILYMQADTASRAPDVQELFYRAAEDGLVFLSQKKVAEGVYNYLARRLSKKAGKILKPNEVLP